MKEQFYTFINLTKALPTSITKVNAKVKRESTQKLVIARCAWL